ncbi:MAG: hypothetical protein R3Y21_01765 [Mycoplasmatota bacterium]
MICNKCGTNNSDNQTMCIRCGNQLSATNFNYNTNSKSNTSKNTRRNNYSWILVIILITVVFFPLYKITEKKIECKPETGVTMTAVYHFNRLTDFEFELEKEDNIYYSFTAKYLASYLEDNGFQTEIIENEEDVVVKVINLNIFDPNINSLDEFLENVDTNDQCEYR